MKTGKKKRLETAGWKVGTADAFLGLSRKEAKIVESKSAKITPEKGRRKHSAK